MNNKSKIKLVIFAGSVFAMSLICASLPFFMNCKLSNIEYYYPSPDGRYTAVISENDFDYFVHIKPEITLEYLEQSIENEKNPNKEEIFFSKYAYGKNGSFIIEWEKQNNILWIWSGDIGLYIIRKKETFWEELPYSEIQSEIDINNMPENIRKTVGKYY